MPVLVPTQKTQRRRREKARSSILLILREEQTRGKALTIISVLQTVNAHRNTYSGHGGILTDQIAVNLLPDLEASLAEVRSCYGTYWDRYLLISPTTETQWTGERFKVVSQILKGSRSPFPTDVHSLVAPLKTGTLYFLELAEDHTLELGLFHFQF